MCPESVASSPCTPHSVMFQNMPTIGLSLIGPTTFLLQIEDVGQRVERQRHHGSSARMSSACLRRRHAARVSSRLVSTVCEQRVERRDAGAAPVVDRSCRSPCVGMFFVQKIEHRPGFEARRRLARRAPAGSCRPAAILPNRSSADWFLIVMSKPAVFSCCWRICSVSSRRLLPVVVLDRERRPSCRPSPRCRRSPSSSRRRSSAS